MKKLQINDNTLNKTTKKTWSIPVCWEMCGIVNIEADTLEDAVDIALNDESVGLPDGDYIDGSWELSFDDIEYIRECYNNGRL